MWALYNQATLYHKTPAELLFIKDEYEAFCFNEAVTWFGNFITNELDRIEGKDAKQIQRKRQNKLNQLLGVPDEKRFRQVGQRRKKN